ncbi:hypothetical protein PVK06_043144 [Gossypium arboreum]|uniref:Uncharacterized protein n=1 Tax=Gossypium arboreum TaxID=29729 RepID=A0ABR0MN36_GOSAR|nr:hypothetical protein PVK06_043144 [Gossypium arboreum]
MTTNLVEAVNSVLRHTCHLPIYVVFSATFYRLATLMPRMRLRQAKQIEAVYVYIEAIQKAMTVNSQRAQTMNAELYSRGLETFRVQEYIGCHLGLPPRLYTVDLRNKRSECRIFQTFRYPCAGHTSVWPGHVSHTANRHARITGFVNIQNGST